MKLPIQPPIRPMLAVLQKTIPQGSGWQYEMKVDGFRAIVFWDGNELVIQSRDLKPLNRYFPELEKNLKTVLPANVVLDGEIVIEGPKGLDFDALLQRIHPAASRIQKLAEETPSSFIVFDLLAQGKQDFHESVTKDSKKQIDTIAEKSQTASIHCAGNNRP